MPNTALRWDGQRLQIIDQTLLPAQETWIELTGAADTAEAIVRLAVRGAPNIGIAAAYGLAMEIARASADDGDDVLVSAADLLRGARPTAVNLAWAVERVGTAALAAPPSERASWRVRRRRRSTRERTRRARRSRCRAQTC